ncbi:MAG TPA: cytochrome c [Vicinamibacterales bacterium]|nr:cytochrome c [Vicinamibacterales bacterium]
MFRQGLAALTVLLVCGIALRAQDSMPRIWQGIYTAAQADRGKTTFNTACLRCHGADLSGTTAPALKGERFQATWGGDTVEGLFGKIRDTMPPNFGTVVDDQAKLDVVAFILQTNGYPAGSTELVIDSPDLAASQILKKGEQASVQNFSLVQTVGCLTRENDKWRLTRTAEPMTARDETPSAQALASAANRPLGTKTFLLLSTKPFDPEKHAGHKMEARGLIYNEPGDLRLTLTSLRMAGTCQ